MRRWATAHRETRRQSVGLSKSPAGLNPRGLLPASKNLRKIDGGIAVTDRVFPNLDRERRIALEMGAEFRASHCRNEAETIGLVHGASVVFVSFPPITAAVLEVLAPGVVVIRYGVGWDNVDVDSANLLGVSMWAAA